MIVSEPTIYSLIALNKSLVFMDLDKDALINGGVRLEPTMCPKRALKNILHAKISTHFPFNFCEKVLVNFKGQTHLFSGKC